LKDNVEFVIDDADQVEHIGPDKGRFKSGLVAKYVSLTD
jgi:hypothetical protein